MRAIERYDDSSAQNDILLSRSGLQVDRHSFSRCEYTCFRLIPLETSVRVGFALIITRSRRSGEQVCVLPTFEKTPLLVIRRDAEAQIWVNLNDVKIEPISILSHGLSGLRMLTRAFKRAVLHFGAIEVRPDGSKKKTLGYRKFVKFARSSAMPFDGDLIRRHPELVFGWTHLANPPPIAVMGSSASIAVVVHLHYTELWPEINARLMTWSTPFKLFITTTSANEIFERDVKGAHPDCHFEVIDNSGRDVRPFLDFLERGLLDSFTIVCKIHGKRSLRNGVSPLFGELFRRLIYFDLINSDAQVKKITGLFNADHRIGIVGPERFRASSRHGKPTEIMGASRKTIKLLAAKMGGKITASDYDVFLGTMFWVRPKALDRLKRLELAKYAFAPEAGLSDGALEHAVEGLFNYAVRLAGFTVAGVSGD